MGKYVSQIKNLVKVCHNFQPISNEISIRLHVTNTMHHPLKSIFTNTSSVLINLWYSDTTLQHILALDVDPIAFVKSRLYVQITGCEKTSWLQSVLKLLKDL